MPSIFLYGLLLVLLLPVGVVAEPQLAPEKEGPALFRDLQHIENYYEAIQQKLNPEKSGTSAERPDESSSADNTPAKPLLLQPQDSRSVLTQGDDAIGSFVSSVVANGGGRVGYRDGQRNPFAHTQQVRGTKESLPGVSNLGFQPLQQAALLPPMHLKGLITDSEAGVAALLDIDGAGTFIVREGDTVGLYQTGVNTVIRIRKINRLNLVVEAGSLGQILIIN